MTNTFRVWDPENGDEGDAEDVLSPSAEDAATDFARDRYDRSDYPEEQTIRVRDPGGRVRIFSVKAEPCVEFHAVETCGHCGTRIDYDDQECCEATARRPRLTLDAAARLLGATLAKVADEDEAEWMAETEPHVLRHGYHRRYSFTELEARGGPPSSVAGQVMRRLPNVVQEAAGPTIRVYLVSGKVQIDPVAKGEVA